MASIREVPRRDGGTTFQVLYRIDGRQSSQPLADRESAEKLVALMAQVGPQRALDAYGLSGDRVRSSSGITVETWLYHHIDHLTGVEQYTLDKYRAYVRRDIAPILGGLPLASLTEEDISTWVKSLKGAPKTIRNKYGFLSGALGKAVPKHLATNPASGRRLPRGSGGEEDMRMLSRDEFDLLRESATEHWRPLLELMVASGLRWGEVSALEPKHVDINRNVVKVRQAWKYDSTGYHLGPPKTKRSRRDVDVPADVLAKLDLSGEYVFLNRTGGPVRYHGFKRRVWERAVTKAQLDPKPTPHDLRHTYASWMLGAGVPITVVSRQLGHESIQITVDTYGDVDRASTKAAADVMGTLLGF